MRKRKEKPEISKPENEEGEEEEGNGFYACYLLTSLCPRFKGHTYIGFTVNPKRRIRQHNGEIGCGAWRTKRKRPWEMVCCIYGFPTNVSALQFEWAWQHPIESLAVRKAASTFKSLSGISNKLKLAYTMLTLPSWSSLNISINYFSTKYMKNAAGCPSLPEHMKIQVTPINELPCYVEGDQDVLEKDDDWEYNRDSEETFSFQASGSTQEETSTSMPKEFMDYHTGDDGISCVSDKEFEDNEQEPPTSIPSSIGSTSTSETEVIIEDKDTYISELNYMNLQQPGKKNSTPGRRTTEISKLSSSNDGFPSEYEIIDVSTPSPDCRTSSQRYKRRVTSVRSEIIDLTKSPTFIQL